MKLNITVQGVTYEVDVEVVGESGYAAAPTIMVPSRQAAVAPVSAPAPKIQAKPVAVAGNAIVSPVAGTVIALKCKEGDKVVFGQPLLLIEAMKMETTIAADRDGVVSKINVAAGEAVREGQTLVEFA